MNDWNNLRAGDRVYVRDEKRPYRVRCRDKRFIICTKPYNPKHTVLYFVADLDAGIRGPDDMVFCAGYETDEQCAERLAELQSGMMAVSLWRCVKLEE